MLTSTNKCVIISILDKGNTKGYEVERMEETIRRMIKDAKIHHDYELAEHIYDILISLTVTFNAPSNWRDIGARLAKEITSEEGIYNNNWIYENCRLDEFI